MSRSYGTVRPKIHWVYSVDEVLILYGICRNTLCNWIKFGLRPVDYNRPQLFRGAELRRFHDQRAVDSRRELRTGEFKCFSCKACVFPQVETLRIDPPLTLRFWAHAVCPECGGNIQKILNAPECDSLRECINTNTNPGIIDEGDDATSVGIGKKPVQNCPNWTPENERVLYAFQVYSRNFSSKTGDARLAAIRDFEAFNDFKRFALVTTQQADRYRNHLVASGENCKSLSTIRHRATHLRIFFDWLVKQDGYRRMNETIGDHLLPSSDKMAKAIRPKPRAFPTEAEVRLMISRMPSATLRQRRDRAIVCCSFLYGTRANATASLRLRHVDPGKRMLYQDATEVRVKRSKSQTTVAFPISDPAEMYFREWLEELYQAGCTSQDALFPPDNTLVSRHFLANRSRGPIEPWKSDSPIRRAFKRACHHAGIPYFNPHSARHFLQSIRDHYCRTPEQRKAWSYNLGHESEQISEVSYAKMTDQRRNDVFGGILPGETETEADKDLLLSYYEHCLAPGTPEFEPAEKLAESRRQRRKPSA